MPHGGWRLDEWNSSVGSESPVGVPRTCPAGAAGARQMWQLSKKLIARRWMTVSGTSDISATTGSLSMSGMLSTGMLAGAAMAPELRVPVLLRYGDEPVVIR